MYVSTLAGGALVEGFERLTATASCDDGAYMRDVLTDKLRPDRFSAMSGKMAAIVGYILDERFTEPAISELVVTSDGFVLAQTEGEVGVNDLIGTEADLNRNLLGLLAAAGRLSRPTGDSLSDSRLGGADGLAGLKLDERLQRELHALAQDLDIATSLDSAEQVIQCRL